MAWTHWLSLGAAALSSPEAKTERRPKARLRLEPLEQRDPAAGVSATLAAGLKSRGLSVATRLAD